MALKNLHGSGSPLTLCLIILLSIAFFAPLYHSHDHAADYHEENSYDHGLLHNGTGYEGLTDDEQHKDSHLHIRNDIGRTDTGQRFKSSSLKPDLCATTESPLFTEQYSRMLVKHTQQAPVFRSNSRDCLSGLSPPIA